MEKENVIPRKRLENETEEQYEIYLREFYFGANKPQPETRYQFAYDNNLVDSEIVMDGKDGAYIKYLEEFYSDYYKELDEKVSHMISKPKKIKIEPAKLSSLKAKLTRNKKTKNNEKKKLNIKNIFNKNNKIDKKEKTPINWKSLLKRNKEKQEKKSSTGKYILTKLCSGLCQLMAVLGLFKLAINAILGSSLLSPIIQVLGGIIGATVCEIALTKEKKIRKQAKKAAKKEKRLQRKFKLKEGLSKLLSKKKTDSESEMQELITPEESFEEVSYFDTTPDEEQFEFGVESEEELVEEEITFDVTSDEEEITFDVTSDEEEIEFNVEPEESYDEENDYENSTDAYVQVGSNGEYIFNTNYEQEKVSLREKISNIFKKKDTNQEKLIEEDIIFDVTPDEELESNLDFEQSDFAFDVELDQEIIENNYRLQRNQIIDSKVVFGQDKISGTSINIEEFTEPKQLPRTLNNQTTEIQKVKKLK